MKLTYDSFEGVRNLGHTDITTLVRKSFTEFKKSQGWPTKKGQYPYPNSHENIDAELKTFSLPEKFPASKSRSLSAAIKGLEEQVRAGIEEQIEEEQSQSRDSQEGKKPSARSISIKSAGGSRF